MPAVDEHISRVLHIPDYDELAAGVDYLGFLGVRSQVEVVPPLGRRVGRPVALEGGVAHAGLGLRHGRRTCTLSMACRESGFTCNI